MTDENRGFEEPTVILTDATGQGLPCSIEQTFEIDDQEYLLLLPIDAPIEIFVWQGEGEDDEVLIDIDEAEIDQLFPTARAVLAEQNLTLQRSAITLTAAGELPEVNEDDCLTLEVEEVEEDEEAATEEFQILATFYHQDQEYTLCTPLNPLLIFARRTSNGQLEVVTPEEFQKIRAMLEEKLFDIFE